MNLIVPLHCTAIMQKVFTLGITHFSVQMYGQAWCFDLSTSQVAYLDAETTGSLTYSVLYQCRACSLGCTSCTGPAPCLALFNWNFRWNKSTLRLNSISSSLSNIFPNSLTPNPTHILPASLTTWSRNRRLSFFSNSIFFLSDALYNFLTSVLHVDRL